MALIKVGPAAGLQPGGLTEVEHNGATYAVGNHDGEFFCVDGVCPHAGGPLGQGTMNGKMVTCPWHGWEFDCRTGVNDFDEDVQIATFPVKVEGEDLYIELP